MWAGKLVYEYMLPRQLSREIIGRTLRSTVLLSLICGVMIITKPTETEFGVVVTVDCDGPEVLFVVSDLTVK